MDVDIVASKDSGAQNKVAVKVAQGQSLNNAAIPSYVEKLAGAGQSAPANSAAAPSLAAKSAPAQSAPVSTPAAQSAPVSAATPAAVQTAPAQNPAAQMQTLVLVSTSFFFLYPKITK